MGKEPIIIDGRPLTFTSGQTILEAATENGIDIPTLCHLKGTLPTGTCRICIVEVEGYSERHSSVHAARDLMNSGTRLWNIRRNTPRVFAG